MAAQHFQSPPQRLDLEACSYWKDKARSSEVCRMVFLFRSSDGVQTFSFSVFMFFILFNGYFVVVIEQLAVLQALQSLFEFHSWGFCSTDRSSRWSAVIQDIVTEPLLLQGPLQTATTNHLTAGSTPHAVSGSSHRGSLKLHSGRVKHPKLKAGSRSYSHMMFVSRGVKNSFISL